MAELTCSLFKIYTETKFAELNLNRECIHLFRTARDTDYLLISEDIEKYGCGCCSIGVGNIKDVVSQVEQQETLTICSYLRI